jgi:hypothetical protein
LLTDPYFLPGNMSQKIVKRRSNRGNMIVLVAAVIVGIIVTLMAFGFNYVRMLSGHQGQDTAIQAAALTAASDISRIVINSPEFGFVSFSDGAPIGSGTTITDKWETPIRSVNTLIGTARLEYIIGQALGDSTMQSMANLDCNTITNTVVPELNKAINSAIVPGGTAQDLNNNTITPYADAELAFEQNLKRTGGGASCDYVSGSLILTMGVLTAGNGIATNIPVPHSSDNTYAAPTISPQMNGNYVSETDMQIGTSAHFTFGSIGSSVRLVEQSNFTGDNGLPVQIPAIVKAEANEVVSDNQKANNMIHAVACAAPASVYDPRPAPGALSFSFPDGPIPEIQSPKDMTTNSNISALMVDTTNNSPKAITPFANLQTPGPGDYPLNPGSQMNGMAWPLGSATPTMSQVWMVSFYDWVRRGGVKADIGAVCDAFTTKFNPLSTGTKHWITYTSEPVTQPEDITLTAPGQPIPQGIMYIYKFNSTGGVVNSSKPISPMPYNVLAEKQMYAEGLKAITSSIGTFFYPSTQYVGGTLAHKVDIKGAILTGVWMNFTNLYDIYVRDECRNYGPTNGGIHGGEPLDDPAVALLPGRSHLNLCLSGKSGVATARDCGGGGTGAHPGGGPPTGGLGSGAIPLISTQSDFAEPLPGAPSLPAAYSQSTMYDQYSVGPGSQRPTYTTNGSSIEVRFRRQIWVQKDTAYGTPPSDTGYLFFP